MKITADTSYDIVLAGRGGQGVIYLSRVMGQAALLQGLGVRTTETHGMAMRGGSVQCFVRIGKAHGPLFRTGCANLLMALCPDETHSALPLLSKDGIVLINDRKGTTAATVQTHSVLMFDAVAAAVKCRNARSANLALLGYAAATLDGFPLVADSIEEAIRLGPARNADKNIEVFRLGFERSPNVSI